VRCDESDEFSGLGESIERVFAEDELIANFDIEYASAAFDQGGGQAVSGLDLFHRTGGLRKVVSHAAEFDRDRHIFLR
jgi:hypothetical protein